MTREEAIERLKQNKAAAEFYAGMVQNTNAIENELKDIEAMNMAIEALSADAVQIPIKLEKRYPQSRDEDITDAFMRGYLAGRSSADRPTGECKTCKRCSDYLWSKGKDGTECPIEEHYALPKDGYCHLYEQI